MRREDVEICTYDVGDECFYTALNAMGAHRVMCAMAVGDVLEPMVPEAILTLCDALTACEMRSKRTLHLNVCVLSLV